MDVPARVAALVLLWAVVFPLVPPLVSSRSSEFSALRRRRSASVVVSALPTWAASLPRSVRAVAVNRHGEARSHHAARGDGQGRSGGCERPVSRRSRPSGRWRCLAPFEPALTAVWWAWNARELAIAARQDVELTSALALAATKRSLELPGSVLSASGDLDRWALVHAVPH